MPSMELIKKLRDMTQAGVMDAKKALEINNDDLDLAVQWLREKGIAKAAKKADAVAAEGVVSVLIKDDRAIILEVNSQTDFVATNEQFKSLVNDIALSLLENGEYDVEKALKMPIVNQDGVSIEQACINLTAKIGEKIVVRRFEILTKQQGQQFASYVHFNGRTAVLLLLEKAVEEKYGKDVAMHAAAMAPKYLSKDVVDQKWLENEAKILKEQTIAEGKPADRAEMIVKGRVNKLLSEVTLLAQQFVKDPSKTVEQYLKEANTAALTYVRYEVGEGIEKAVVDFAAEVAAQMGNK